MATKQPRLNVVLEAPIYESVRKIANKEGVSLSLAARDLMKKALELYEDSYWNEIAVKRDKSIAYKKAITPEKKIFKTASKLNPIDRAELIEDLYNTFECKERLELDELYAEEAESRIDAFEQGKIKKVSINKVFKDINKYK